MQTPKWLRKALGPTGGHVALLMVAVLVAYLGLYRHMRFFLVPSASMEPTLLVGDYLVTLNAETYKRGDVIVLEDPEDPSGYIVKRLIALGGEEVKIIGGCVYVNGEYLSEPYTSAPPIYGFGPYKVPDNSAFVLGDNRNNSEDSHRWSQSGVSMDSIVGRVRFIYYPYSRWGRVRSVPVVSAPLMQDAR